MPASGSERLIVALDVETAAEARVREIAGPRAALVTPGVCSAGASAGDQKRVATPAEAIANGADYLVIGRQVTRSSEWLSQSTEPRAPASG